MFVRRSTFDRVAQANVALCEQNDSLTERLIATEEALDLAKASASAEAARLRQELIAERNTSAKLRGQLVAEAHAAGLPSKADA